MGQKGGENQRSLQLDDLHDHHVRGWHLKRVSWAFLFAILGAAMAGFLGNGPFSRTSISGSGGLQLDYLRISRYHAPTRLMLIVPGGKDPLELSLNAEFIRAIDIEHIDPQPAEMRLAGENHTWIFPRSAERSEIKIAYRPGAFGARRIRLEAKGAGALELKQFILP